MTNFEKWKKNLKPEDLFFPDIISDCERPKLECTQNCPARETCPIVLSAKNLDKMRENLPHVDRRNDPSWQAYFDAQAKHYGLGYNCKAYFTEWANKEENI